MTNWNQIKLCAFDPICNTFIRHAATFFSPVEVIGRKKATPVGVTILDVAMSDNVGIKY